MTQTQPASTMMQLRCANPARMATALIALCLASAALSQQMPPIGIIDFYGLGHIPEAQARTVRGLKIGDSVPESRGAIEARLRAIPGVVAARLNAVCCDAVSGGFAPPWHVNSSPQNGIEQPSPSVPKPRSLITKPKFQVTVPPRP